MYVKFLGVTSQRFSNLALEEISPLETSHDQTTRWLKGSKLKPCDLWKQAKPLIQNPEGGLLIADDFAIDKSRSTKIEIVSKIYSGTKHKVIPGISVVDLIWTEAPEDRELLDNSKKIPVDFRVWDKKGDRKTKNEHFREMLVSAKKRGLKPKAIVVDTWYASLENLKLMALQGFSFVSYIAKNRRINHGVKISDLDIPNDGVIIYLRGFGPVKVLRFDVTKYDTKYLITNDLNQKSEVLLSYAKARWDIEVFHREIKQTCGIERCQALSSRAQRNHILCSFLAWIDLLSQRCSETTSAYRQQWEFIKSALSQALNLSFFKTA